MLLMEDCLLNFSLGHAEPMGCVVLAAAALCFLLFFIEGSTSINLKPLSNPDHDRQPSSSPI